MLKKGVSAGTRSGLKGEGGAGRGCHRGARRRRCHGAAPHPASGPSHSRAGPAHPWAPPASGTTAAGQSREADNFLLPGSESGSNSQGTGVDARPNLAPSSRPTLPPKTETRDVLAQAGILARFREHGFLLPLAFRSSSSMLLSRC